MFLHGHNIDIYASRWRNLSHTGALYCICTGTSWERWWVGPNCALCTASALGPLEKDGGPNCAAGLVLVLSVDTLVLQLATVSTVGYEQCIGHGWKGHRGRRGKCDLQSRLTPAGPTYHVPTMLRRALLMIRPTWLLRQSKQLKESETDGCWLKPGITIHFIFHNILKIFDWGNSNVPFKLRY